MIPSRDFATATERVSCAIVVLPLRSIGTKPVAFDERRVVRFTCVTAKCVALSCRVYRRIWYEVLSRLAIVPFTWIARVTSALAFAEVKRSVFTLSGNGLIVRLPSVRTGVMFDVQYSTTSLAGSV